MIEIVAPYYRTDGTVVGDWIDLNAFADLDYNPDFLGHPVETAISGDIFVSGGGEPLERFKFSTTNPAIAITIGNFEYMSALFDYATIYMCDVVGNVVASLAWTRALGPSQPWVWFPFTGEDFYLIIVSDTGRCDFRKEYRIQPVEVEIKSAYFQLPSGSHDVIVNRFLDDAGVEQILDEYFVEAAGTTELIFFVGAIPTWPDPEPDPPPDPEPDPDTDPLFTVNRLRLYEATDQRIFEATDIRMFEA